MLGSRKKESVMYEYRPFLSSNYGPLPVENDISRHDYFSMITPENRDEIVAKEAAWYRSLHTEQYAEGGVETRYLFVTDRKVRIKVYDPIQVKNEIRPVFIFIHGGAFMTCSSETHDFIPWYIAKQTGVRCISIDYRLIPEHPFPAGLTDCKNVVRWVYANAQALHIDPDHLYISGDSSGGNFSAVLALMDRDEKTHRIAKQLLFVPLVDVFAVIPKKSKEVYGWPSIDFAHMYVPEEQKTNPYVSPLLCDDLNNICPAFFVQAECDGICDDGLYYAQKLKDFGVSVKSKIYSGMPHSFNVYAFKQSFQALDDMCAYIEET